jgi:hypothetical protein
MNDQKTDGKVDRPFLSTYLMTIEYPNPYESTGESTGLFGSIFGQEEQETPPKPEGFFMNGSPRKLVSDVELDQLEASCGEEVLSLLTHYLTYGKSPFFLSEDIHYVISQHITINDAWEVYKYTGMSGVFHLNDMLLKNKPSRYLRMPKTMESSNGISDSTREFFGTAYIIDLFKTTFMRDYEYFANTKHDRTIMPRVFWHALGILKSYDSDLSSDRAKALMKDDDTRRSIMSIVDNPGDDLEEQLECNPKWLLTTINEGYCASSYDADELLATAMLTRALNLIPNEGLTVEQFQKTMQHARTYKNPDRAVLLILFSISIMEARREAAGAYYTEYSHDASAFLSVLNAINEENVMETYLSIVSGSMNKMIEDRTQPIIPTRKLLSIDCLQWLRELTASTPADMIWENVEMGDYLIN